MDARKTRMTFELDRFEWATPDRIEISGRWSGVDPERLGTPELVVRHAGRTTRLAAIEHAQPPSDDHESWKVAFEWEAGPVTLDPAHLEFPDGKVLELPPVLRPGRLRQARQRLARGRHAADAPARAAGGDAGAGAEKTETEDVGLDAPDTAPPRAALPLAPVEDTLALQFDVRTLRDELEVAREELEQLREEAARARQEAERSVARRHADAERFRVDLENMKRLAEKALQHERDARAELAERLAAAEREAESARRRERRLRQALDALRQEVVDTLET
jgi:hypothetical protein